MLSFIAGVFSTLFIMAAVVAAAIFYCALDYRRWVDRQRERNKSAD